MKLNPLFSFAMLVMLASGAGPAVAQRDDGIGWCRDEGKCPCSKQEEQKGKKTIGGSCVDCAGNAKELEKSRAKREALDAEIKKVGAQMDGLKGKLRDSWNSVQREVPNFSDAVKGYVDLPARVRGISSAVQDRTLKGPRALRTNLSEVYRDVSDMAKFLPPLPERAARILRDLSDSVRYDRQYSDARGQRRDLNIELALLAARIAAMREIEEKCSGKGKKRSGQIMFDGIRIATSMPPGFLRVAAPAGSPGEPPETPCGGSTGKPSRCEEARQALADIRGFDIPETNVAFREVLRILEPFTRDNADKISDQEVFNRAKEVDAALKNLAELLDRLVSRSNKVLSQLQGENI